MFAKNSFINLKFGMLFAHVMVLQQIVRFLKILKILDFLR